MEDEEYVDYHVVPESRHEEVEGPDTKGYRDYYASDGSHGDFFGPAFDEFFKKVEGGIEEEITSVELRLLRQESSGLKCQQIQ